MIRLIAGLVYGLILGALSFLLMGAGHGTYVPFAISSSPFAVVNYPPFTIVLGLIAVPILWTFVAVALEQRWNRVVRLTLIVHYIGIAVSLLNPIDGDWSYFESMMRSAGAIVFLWALTYLVGQIVVWYFLLKARPMQQAAQPAAAADP